MTTDTLAMLFQWAWRASLGALPLAIVAVAIWRWRSMPVAWRWWLPALFFLRLAMPQVPQVGWRTDALSVAAHTPRAVAAVAPVASPVPRTVRALDWLPLGWACGALGVASWIALSHLRLARSIRRHSASGDEEMQRECDRAGARMGLSARVPVKVMPGAGTLAIHGWWRPVLLVPHDLAARFTPAQIRGMLLHEMAHVRRRDVLWTWLALGVCTLHWFNPLAWLALRRFHADRELACDAAALRALDSTARHDYGEALLRCLQGPSPAAPLGLAPFFHRFPELKLRLQNIMNPTSPTALTRLLAALLIPSLMAITFTTARAQREGEAAKQPDLTMLCRRLYLDLAGTTPTPAEVQAFNDAATRDKQAAISDLVIRLTAAEKRPRRDGDGAKPAAREGERPREGARDGDRPKTGLREGEAPKRDGDRPRTGLRDGDRPREGARDGDRPKAGPREGEQPRRGLRDGERPRTGPRDGEGTKAGPRDGETPREGVRDGARPAPEARNF